MKDLFLLHSPTAADLYAGVKDLPIIDYHNHLSLADLVADRRFTDVYDLWIAPDPYKHRAMRMCGVPEREITGDATPREKFLRWCETLPKLWGNPLAQWSRMELESVFGITEQPCAANAADLYDRCNTTLRDNVVTPLSLFDRFRVEEACPCASLVDEIGFFEGNARLSPSLRGDDILAPTPAFMQKLEGLTGVKITDTATFKAAVSKRLDDFERCGLTFADHALDNGFRFDRNAAEGSPCDILTFLGGEYARRGMVLQLHLGAQRATSARLRAAAGAAGGFAGIGNSVDVRSLTDFLDTLEQGPSGLPKVVLFPLNPADNALVSTLSGSFSKDGAAGLITQGPAWWWCDHKQGIVDMLEHTAVYSVLANFIGMTTDSRSFLSLVRHDYFRRVLCDWAADKRDAGEWIGSEEGLRGLLTDLCYGNAKRVLG
ncbi:MAG: glucuronate isomerase [Clostridia bacterium]|nr:glucuronate isomerase [Clostridia bacterium]